MQKSSKGALDAVELLIADHKAVAAMFEKYEGLGDRAFAAKMDMEALGQEIAVRKEQLHAELA